MQRLILTCAVAFIFAAPSAAPAQQGETGGPYRVLKTVKAGGGDGGFDYTNVDVDGRRLYVARRGAGAQVPHIAVFDLDTLAQVGDIPNVNAHGAVIDAKSGHGFASNKPIVMFDSKTLMPIKQIEVQGNPDGMFFDPYNQRAYVLSHEMPHVTVIDSKDGNVLGTIDLGGAPEQMTSDGRGHVYVDVEDMHNVAVIDANSMKVTAHYDLQGQGGTCAGLAMDPRSRVLFAACRNPQNMVMMNADTGKILGTVPLGRGTDGAVFNPATGEAFSSQTDGTLTVVKENSPTSFAVEQTVQTMPTAKTMALDTKTNHLVLIAAQYPPEPPRPAQGGQGARAPMIPGSFTILLVGK